MRDDLLKRCVLGILAVGNLLNGAWMLIAPSHWYYHLPAAVPDSGPLNVHFVRDIGSAYFACGVALALAVILPSARLALLLTVTTFYGFHALVHLFDIAKGHLPISHVYIDIPGVFIPVLILILVTWWIRKT